MSLNLETPQFSSPESKEEKEQLQENEIIISELGLETARIFLIKNNYPYEETLYKEKEELNPESETEVPAEYVLTIFNPDNPNQPANFELIKEIYNQLRSLNVAVRYGYNPEAAE